MKTSELEPGMRLARSLIHQHQVLVTANHKLTQTDIVLMQRRGVHKVLVADPLLDKYCEFDDTDKHDRDVAVEVQKRVVESVEKIENNLKSTSTLSAQDMFALQSSIAECINYIQQNPVATAFLDKTHDAGDYLKQHAMNVFYLSLLIGFKMRSYIHSQRRDATSAQKIYKPFDLNPLGLGAMLIDVGMHKLEHLARRGKNLNDREMALIRQHPAEGYKMLPNEIPAHSRLIVKYHHENFNGTGYPEGLRGNEIQVFARIVRIADAFDAGTSQTVYREAKSQVKILHEMTLGAYRSYFDPVIMKVFSTMIQPFPIGAKIKLTNGRYGGVVIQNPENPFFPVLVIAFDDSGRKLSAEHLDKPINMAQTKGLKMVSFGNEDLRFLYSPEALSPVRVDRHEVTSLFEMMYP